MVFPERSPVRRVFLAFGQSLVLAALAAAAILCAAPAASAQQQGTVRAQGKDVKPDETEKWRPAQSIEPREEMRRLIRAASRYLRSLNPNFIIIVEGGLDLLETEDAIDPTATVPAASYIRAIDGLLIDGIKFPRTLLGDTKLARKRDQERIERLAALGKARDLRVLVTDFTASANEVREAYRFNHAKGYVSFPVSKESGFESIPKIPHRPFGENPNNVTGVSDIRNFLILTDSSEYDSREDFVLALSATNFDAVVVDVFHRGRRPFTRLHVDGMKYKKLGARRLVLAHMDIGHARSDSYFWKPDWKEGAPKWIASPVAGHPDRFFVEYWQPDWRKLMLGNANSYLYGIAAQGYDGVVIDGVDAYRFFEGTVQ